MPPTILGEVFIKYTGGRPCYLCPRWELARPLRVVLSNGELLTIPAGFKTDLSSVPRFLWSIFPPYGDFLAAAIVHDYFYIIRYKMDELGPKEARKLADKEMLYLSKKYNPGRPADNYIRFWAVRLFGGAVYK